MALNDTFNIERPGQSQQTGSISALHIEQYTGVVESTIERKMTLKGYVPLRPVKGTSTITNFAIGESTLQKAQPGSQIDGTTNDFSKKTLTVDTVILARTILPMLEVFQTSYDARKEIGQEHGKKIAKFCDQSFYIQAIKASLLADSAYRSNGTASQPAGHFGGSLQVLGAAGDALDPAKFYAAISDLFVKMQEKDVDPASDDVVLAVRPAQFHALAQNEQLIDGTYITSDGNKLQGTAMLKTYGVPIVSSTNFPGGQAAITGHLLGASFDGDYSKVVATAFSPRALLAGETIPLTTDVFWDKVTKQWYVDAHLAYNVTSNRAEFAGSILKP